MGYNRVNWQNNISTPINATTLNIMDAGLLDHDNKIIEGTGYGIISGLTVSAQSIPNMTVSVATGTIHMPNGDRFNPVVNTSLAINASDSTKPRVDLVYINSGGIIAYLAGSLGTAAVAGSETYTITTNAVAGDTITINGLTLTAVSSGATGNQFNVGADTTATATNIKNVLSANVVINTLYTVTSSGNIITITEKIAGGCNTPSIATKTGTIAITNGTVVTSTPQVYPIAPSTPVGGLLLSYLTIGAGITSITNANIIDKRLIKYANQTPKQYNSFKPVNDFLGICSFPMDDTLAAKLIDYKFKYVRMDVTWQWIENTIGVFNYGALETRINTAIAHGLKPVLILDYSNTLYCSSSSVRTDYEINAYKNYITNVVNKWKNKGVIWELWNEPNMTTFWQPQDSTAPTLYANLVKNVYDIVKSLDPTSTVMVGALAGTNPNAQNWFKTACDNGLLDYADAISLHFYSGNAPETCMDLYRDFRSIIANYTDRNIPIMTTEFGLSTVPNWDGIGTNCVFTEDVRAKYMPRYILSHIISRLDKIFIYVSVTGRTTNTNIEDWFGIFEPTTYVATPTADAIKNLMTELDGYSYVRRIRTKSADYILQFVDINNNYKYAYWTTGSSHTKWIESIQVTLTDTVQFFDSSSAFDYYFNDTNTLNLLYDTLKYKPGIINKYTGEIFNDYTNVARNMSHAEGYNCASLDYGHSEGRGTLAGTYAHAEGLYNIAVGGYRYVVTAVDIPNQTVTLNTVSNLTTGIEVYFKVDWGNAVICNITAINGLVVTIDTAPTASFIYMVYKTVDSAQHAEGTNTLSTGAYSHAEGYGTLAVSPAAHAEGYLTQATGMYSHAEGEQSQAQAEASHAEGKYTFATNFASHSCGKYNKVMVGGGTSSNQVGDAFVIGNGTSSGALSNAFRIGFDGGVYGTQAYQATGADFAEFGEWLDGNPDNEDRRGYFVTLDGKMLLKANEGDYIRGVTSANPCLVGNADIDWIGKYLRDEFGGFIYEDVVEEDGTITPNGRLKLNPLYDPNIVYIPRNKRKEFSYVGLTGIVSVRDDGTCVVNGYCKPSNGIATTAEREIDTYRVVSRVNANIIEIIIK